MVFLPLILITRGALMRGTHPFLHLMRAAAQRRWHDPIFIPACAESGLAKGIPKGADLCLSAENGREAAYWMKPALHSNLMRPPVPISFRPAFRNGQFLMVARSNWPKPPRWRL